MHQNPSSLTGLTKHIWGTVFIWLAIGSQFAVIVLALRVSSDLRLTTFQPPHIQSGSGMQLQREPSWGRAVEQRWTRVNLRDTPNNPKTFNTVRTMPELQLKLSHRDVNLFHSIPTTSNKSCLTEKTIQQVAVGTDDLTCSCIRSHTKHIIVRQFSVLMYLIEMIKVTSGTTHPVVQLPALGQKFVKVKIVGEVFAVSQKVGWKVFPDVPRMKTTQIGKRKIQTKNWKNDIDDTLMLSKCSIDTCIFANPQDFLWNACGIDQPFLAVLHYQEFPRGSRSFIWKSHAKRPDNQKPSMVKIVQRSHEDTTSYHQPPAIAGWFGALESLGLGIPPLKQWSLVYGSMGMWSSSPMLNLEKCRPKAHQAKESDFLLCCIPFFARPSHV